MRLSWSHDPSYEFGKLTHVNFDKYNTLSS